MRRLWIAIIIVLGVIWGVASISQSYAAAKQAEAAIEASRATQIISISNLVMLLLIVLLVVIVLAALGVIAWLSYRLKIKPMPDQTKGSQVRRQPQAAPSATELLPQLMVMLMYQMAQQNQLPNPAQSLRQIDTETAPVETIQDIWTR